MLVLENGEWIPPITTSNKLFGFKSLYPNMKPLSSKPCTEFLEDGMYEHGYTVLCALVQARNPARIAKAKQGGCFTLKPQT